MSAGRHLNPSQDALQLAQHHGGPAVSSPPAKGQHPTTADAIPKCRVENAFKSSAERSRLWAALPRTSMVPLESACANLLASSAHRGQAPFGSGNESLCFDQSGLSSYPPFGGSGECLRPTERAYRKITHCSTLIYHGKFLLKLVSAQSR